ncbi:MAG: CCA tRNA nucleotidyltransferase [Candidatus Zixiibacteriota bacterium]
MLELSSSVGETAMQLAQEVIDAITARGQLYEVGGTVRDELLGKRQESKDSDFLVTGIPYQDLVSILRNFGRVDIVGKSFGVIKFSPRETVSDVSTQIDFALPRKEYSTGEGHRDFAVNFDHTLPVQDDLYRRDFTINAIALNVATGEIVDPLNGRRDIVDRLLRYTTAESFKEDPLRMLRAVQFAARLGFTIEEKTYQSICDNVRLIETVSAERIAEELNKLLIKADKPSIGFQLMQATGLLQYILPELQNTVGVEQPGPYHAWPVFQHTIYTVDAAPKKLLTRMACLFHDIAKPQAKRLTEEGGATFYGHETYGARITRDALERLRYSNDFIDDVVTLVDRHMFTTDVSDKGLRRLIRKTGLDLIYDLLDVRRADVAGQGKGGNTDDVDVLEQRIREEIAKKPPFGLGDLALNGNDIMREFNLAPGKEVGLVLNYLLEIVLDFPDKNNFETLMAEAKSYFRNSTHEGLKES